MEQYNDKRRMSHQSSKRIGAINGSLPTYDRFFYLARAALNPPTSLCKKFPGDPIQPTVAEKAFVQVIMMFGKTSIQDSVLTMELHPCYPIWQHSIFSDPASCRSKGSAAN
ncbi:hypothetical protein [Absidia glauca]|uniref:Ndc10 domain-containing protein n=1 Tax=Absidia glauca TaxID=4829 RepID=A0A163JS45_ABSGL|nr:hypothetical protein [Absidia glauca]